MKRINLDQMKNMSIDNLIELYRDGYRLEEHTPIIPLSDFNTFNFSNILSNIHTLQGPLLDPVVNFGKVTVSAGYDATETSIILNTNEGSKLPDPSSVFNLVWWNSTDYPDPSDDPNKEIVRCTTRTTDTLTVTRAQEGTSASIKNLAGKTYKMILSPTAKTISDISSAITARVAKTGDTMTGTLNLPTNGLIVGTNQLVVSGGNVGIGTTSPTVTLGLGMNYMTEFPIYFESYSPDVRKFKVYEDYGGMVNPILGTFRYNDGTNFGELAVLSKAYGSTPRALTYRSGIIGTQGTETWYIGMEGKAYFTDIVGIGTTNPFTKLHVYGAEAVTGTVAKFERGGSEKNFYIRPLGNERVQLDSAGAFTFGTNATDTTTGNEVFRINANGNIGIGTTVPTAKLHIGGTAGVDGIKFPDGTLQKTAVTSTGFELTANKNVANGYAGLDANILITETQLGKKAWLSGTDTYHSHDAVASTLSLSYAKLKTITLNHLPNSSLNISFAMATGLGFVGRAKIYRNGVAVGTERSSAGSNIWTTYTEVISGWAEGNTIELWGYTTNGTWSCSVANFRIKYNKNAMLTNS